MFHRIHKYLMDNSISLYLDCIQDSCNQNSFDTLNRWHQIALNSIELCNFFISNHFWNAYYKRQRLNHNKSLFHTGMYNILDHMLHFLRIEMNPRMCYWLGKGRLECKFLINKFFLFMKRIICTTRGIENKISIITFTSSVQACWMRCTNAFRVACRSNTHNPLFKKLIFFFFFFLFKNFLHTDLSNYNGRSNTN